MILHLDLIGGIAGDMTVAALIDVGVPVSVIEESLAAVPIHGYSLEIGRRDAGMAISGCAFNVKLDEEHTHEHTHEHHHEHTHEHTHEHHHEHTHEHTHEHHHEHHHNSWSEIRTMLQSASLRPGVRQRALAIFEHIARAEAWVHDMDVEDVHFHEVGAVDSIVDIVAVAACLEHLKPTEITASVVPTGRGFTMSQHGRIPVPAPATQKILEGIPTEETGLSKELVTPTGAGILRACVSRFGPAPTMSASAVGHGAGRRKLADRPNIVRAILGEASQHNAPDLRMIEANVDDMTPELCAHVAAMLMEAGARDVWWTAIVMKKGRPGHKLSVLCDPSAQASLQALILRETTSLGVRSYPVDRTEVRREICSVQTPYGTVDVKLAWDGQTLVNAAPEYESARALAVAEGIPLKRIMAAAASAAWNKDQ